MRVHNTNGGQPEWPFNQPFYIILNLAIGGNWPGAPNAQTVDGPAVAMEVDYVGMWNSI